MVKMRIVSDKKDYCRYRSFGIGRNRRLANG